MLSFGGKPNQPQASAPALVTARRYTKLVHKSVKLIDRCLRIEFNDEMAFPTEYRPRGQSGAGFHRLRPDCFNIEPGQLDKLQTNPLFSSLTPEATSKYGMWQNSDSQRQPCASLPQQPVWSSDTIVVALREAVWSIFRASDGSRSQFTEIRRLALASKRLLGSAPGI